MYIYTYIYICIMDYMELKVRDCVASIMNRTVENWIETGFMRVLTWG